MSIVLNEYDWAERMINNRELGRKPIETLNRVSKYYFENHYSKNDIRKMLDNFLIQCDPSASLIHWSESLDRVVKGVGKYPLVKLDGIHITKPEIEYINQIQGKQLKRLAFTLLCVAKYWDTVSPNNNHWVNTSDRDIMKMANVNTSIERQSVMFSELRKIGFLKFSKRIDNLNVQILFLQHGESAIYIQDFRNLGYQYLKYCGEAYFECVNCGITEKIQHPERGRKQKYCANCAVELHTKQRVNSVMRIRNNNNKFVC